MEIEQKFDIVEYLGIIKKWWWIPVTLGLVFATISSVKGYFFTQKMYQSNASLYILGKDVQDDKSNIKNDLALGDALIKDYKELIKHRAVLKDVIEELKMDKWLTPQALAQKVRIESKNETKFIEIIVTDSDPKMAATLANKIAEVFTKKVLQIMNVENVQILDKAEVSKNPVSSQPIKSIEIAFVIGIVLGIGIILFIDYMDNALKTVDDVKKHFQWNIIGKLPLMERDAGTETGEKKLYSIAILKEPKSKIAEQFRVLRTSIQFKGLDKELRKILVTSPGLGEGKTTTVVNLAILLAQADMKVLVVDTDLRKACIHNYFDLDVNKGLTMCLEKKAAYEEYIQKTSINGVDVVTSGPVPPDPSELLGSKAMKTFVDNVSTKYDIILFDSPPIGRVTDAAVLSVLSDGVVVVTALGSTKVEAAKVAKEELHKIAASIVGVVVNKIKGNSQKTNY